ncbi:DEAD/DEAH box helicase [Bacillus sp. ISL-47]|uniref:DEAD/DEAH box helicase n=1 Tax=Bacillus sp. ISL-47 TaxID=2819130 RepID=UPI001BEC508D|nr:DEAD/DEAH box helicase [Bacillus sp. ISL-47]MBT2689545.1 DEAD/DEAH box helicase [Bacillus sp. ISL-47]MBT2708364.1 DEAD/DEAH box helicase [Pseudomonas sp. ISL-84]
MQEFLTLGISEQLSKTLLSQGIGKPTPIQEQAIPAVMSGKDLIAQAQTGTGKTFAFILPILEKIDLSAAIIQALIVTPTRELALQITDEIQKLTADNNAIDVLAVYGGQDVDKQLKKLKKNIHIVVGTPGRLLDHIKRETIDLSRTDFLVLDEADQMLHIGFLNEVEDIIKETSPERQTMLFSATIPAEIRKLAKKHMKEPEYIQIEKTQGPAHSVKQLAIHTTDRAKQATIMELVQTHRPYLAVIFCRTKRRVSKLYEVLKTNGFQCDELHGDLSQAKREQVMKRFRDAEIQLLIATDVAARGLDVEGVTHVFNYDIPLDPESYVHRIGRTGRAGTKGLAITFYSSADKPLLESIEKGLNIHIPKQNLGNSQKDQENKKPARNSDKSGQALMRQGSSGRGKRESREETARKDKDSRGPNKKSRQGKSKRSEISSSTLSGRRTSQGKKKTAAAKSMRSTSKKRGR